MNSKQIQRMMNLDLLGELEKGKNMRFDCCKLQLGPRQKFFVHSCPLFSACIGVTAALHKTYVLAAKLAIL